MLYLKQANKLLLLAVEGLLKVKESEVAAISPLYTPSFIYMG
jgi:hypothetical protein